MYWSSRVHVAIYLAFIVWSIAFGSILPMMFVLLPRFYGGWLQQLLSLPQHAGLGEDTYDHRQNTRTIYVNPVFAFLYLNMQYHLEHHAMPMTPFHALPKLHAAVKDQMPPPLPEPLGSLQGADSRPHQTGHRRPRLSRNPSGSRGP